MVACPMISKVTPEVMTHSEPICQQWKNRNQRSWPTSHRSVVSNLLVKDICTWGGGISVDFSVNTYSKLLWWPHSLTFKILQWPRIIFPRLCMAACVHMDLWNTAELKSPGMSTVHWSGKSAHSQWPPFNVWEWGHLVWGICMYTLQLGTGYRSTV